MPLGRCSHCGLDLDKSEFMSAQWKNGAARRKCVACEASTTQATAAVASSSTEPEQKRKGGRPPKAPEELAVQGQVWRCLLDVAPDIVPTSALKEVQVALEIEDVEKLAVRHFSGDAVGSSTIEAFVSLANKWSTTQLGSIAGLPEGVRWERIVETRHGDEWATVRADATFTIIRPEGEALESVRRGLQQGLHVQPAWIEQHVPRLQDVNVRPAVLSPGGTTAARQISAALPTPGGEHREERSASVVEKPRPPAGETKAEAASRADANREHQERALLSLDPAAAHAERAAHAEAERERRGAEANAQSMRARKARLRELLTDAQLLHQRSFGVTWPNFHSADTQPWFRRSSDELASRFIASAEVLQLLRPGLDELSWLTDLLIPSLHCYLRWFGSPSMQSVAQIDFTHAMHEVFQYDTMGSVISFFGDHAVISHLHDWFATQHPFCVFQRGRTVEEDRASDIAWGLCCRELVPEYPLRPLRPDFVHLVNNLPWLGRLSELQIECIVDDAVERQIDDLIATPRGNLRNGVLTRVVRADPCRSPHWSTSWFGFQRDADQFRAALRDHSTNRLSPNQARALCASAARVAQGQLTALEAPTIGASVTLFGFAAADALRYNGQEATVVALMMQADRYVMRTCVPPLVTLDNVARENFLFRAPTVHTEVLVCGSTPSKLQSVVFGEYHLMQMQPAPGSATLGAIYKKQGSPDWALWREAGGRWCIGRHEKIGQGRCVLCAFSSPLSPLGISNWDVWDAKKQKWLRAPRVEVVRPGVEVE